MRAAVRPYWILPLPAVSSPSSVLLRKPPSPGGRLQIAVPIYKQPPSQEASPLDSLCQQYQSVVGYIGGDRNTPMPTFAYFPSAGKVWPGFGAAAPMSKLMDI